MRPFWLIGFLALFFGSLEASTLLVSVAPTKYLVERIVQDRFKVMLLVPAGASPHSYEPTFRQMAQMREALVWFRSGEDFERRALAAFSKELQVVDLREGLPLLTAQCHCHSLEASDSHTWLSPPLLRLQTLRIAETLTQLFPEEGGLFYGQCRRADR